MVLGSTKCHWQAPGVFLASTQELLSERKSSFSLRRCGEIRVEMLSGCEKTTRCFGFQLLVISKVFRFIVLFSRMSHADMTKGQELWRGGVMGPTSGGAVQALVHVVFLGCEHLKFPWCSSIKKMVA